jgi:di/tricarboxylate transporter
MSSTKPAYDVFVTIIFASVALMLLFPSNKYLPLDRRLSCIWGSTLCGLVAYCFNNSLNPLEFVDVDVLIVLSAIMAINFLLLRHPWLSWGIERMQWYIQNDVDKAFYIVSIMSFLISQIIMNDGLCLMIVHPVLDAFIKNSRRSFPNTSSNNIDHHIFDPFYFMLNIACSANIGSVMTFAGNPQNLIIAQYLGNYMNCAVFWAYMLVPAVVAWILTVGLINYLRKEAIRSLREGKQSWALISGVEMVPMSKSRKNERTRGDDSADVDDDHHSYSEERKDGGSQPEAPSSPAAVVSPKSGKSKKGKSQSLRAPEDPIKGVNSPKKVPLTELEGKIVKTVFFSFSKLRFHLFRILFSLLR